eukprot:362709_1
MNCAAPDAMANLASSLASLPLADRHVPVASGAKGRAGGGFRLERGEFKSADSAAEFATQANRSRLVPVIPGKPGSQWTNEFVHAKTPPPIHPIHPPNVSDFKQSVQHPAFGSIPTLADQFLQQQSRRAELQRGQHVLNHAPPVVNHGPPVLNHAPPVMFQHVPLMSPLRPPISNLESAWASGQTWDTQSEPGLTENQQPATSELTLDKAKVAQIMQDQDPKWQQSKFLKFLSDVSEERIKLTDDGIVDNTGQVPNAHPPAAEWASQFNSQSVSEPAQDSSTEHANASESWANDFVEANISTESQPPPSEQLLSNDWASEFNSTDWEKYVKSLYSAKWDPEFIGSDLNGRASAGGIQIEEEVPEYQFESHNPYAEQSDPFERGLRLMREGHLSEAILAFESACQKQPENAEAWKYLGQCCAENENEAGAIAALLRCIQLDPYNLEALLMTAVSFTNELDQSRALEYMQDWLTNHPDYQHLAHADPNVEASLSQHERVTQLFLQAVGARPSDPELNTVLGVLYNLSAEYDRAADYLRGALRAKPDDPTLWNKLGATLANGNRCGEAVEAYRKALAIKPNYVRSFANLGISFSNQGKHHEACQSYLAALSKNSDASHVWSLLKLSLHRMGKGDLIQAAEKKDVAHLRQFFEF